MKLARLPASLIALPILLLGSYSWAFTAVYRPLDQALANCGRDGVAISGTVEKIVNVTLQNGMAAQQVTVNGKILKGNSKVATGPGSYTFNTMAGKISGMVAPGLGTNFIGCIYAPSAPPFELSSIVHDTYFPLTEVGGQMVTTRQLTVKDSRILKNLSASPNLKNLNLGGAQPTGATISTAAPTKMMRGQAEEAFTVILNSIWGGNGNANPQ